MQTYLSLEYEHENELPDGHVTEVRTPDRLVERFLEEYTEPDGRIIDIFAGYGTTLAVAERLDRVPFGLEYEADRVSYIRERLESSDHVRRGSVLRLDSTEFPDCEFCFTSPPFMTETMEENPFRNYSGRSTYDEYLENIETAFANLESVLASDARVVVDVVNMKHEGTVTTLAWDITKRISTTFEFDGEVVVTWEGDGSPTEREGAFGYGFDHSYCLVFSNRRE